jgi:hypothetical protein
MEKRTLFGLTYWNQNYTIIIYFYFCKYSFISFEM